MREIWFRGKRIDNSEWVHGSFCMDALEQFNGLCGVDGFIRLYDKAVGKMQSHEVDRETVGQYTGLKDKNGKRIFEGDILKYKSNDGSYDCNAVVKFGEYEQDGSCGEYSPRRCLGFYVDVINVESAYDWNDTECFPDYYRTQSILEVVDGCEVIGNIYDNYDLLGVTP